MKPLVSVRLAFHLALDLHVVIGRFPQSKVNYKLVTKVKQGEMFGRGTTFVNDSVILVLLLLLLLRDFGQSRF